MTTSEADLKLADQRVRKARMDLLLDRPWFGQLSLHLALTPDKTGAKTKTMATDGSALLYNPAYVLAQSPAVVLSTVAHEVMHCALGHVWRAYGRDWKKWNVATDYVVNAFLSESGFTLWDGALLDLANFPTGTAAETIYATMGDQDPNHGDQPDMTEPGDDPADGNDQGDPGDGTDPSDKPGIPRMSQTDWEVATDQANKIASRAGTLPGGMETLIKQARQTPQDWREILRQFVDQTIPSDYSFQRPNRRFIASGLYLPGILRENTPRLGVCLDTSGSISDLDLSAAGRELSEILHTAHPESIEVAYVDTEIQNTETFTADDPEVILHRRGYGGTLFNPGLVYFSESDNPPAAIVYFSADLDCYDVPTDPGVPVLWITSHAAGRKVMPFGQTVIMENYTH